MTIYYRDKNRAFSFNNYLYLGDKGELINRKYLLAY